MRIEFFVKWSFGRGGYNSAKLKKAFGIAATAILCCYGGLNDKNIQ